MDDEEWNYLNRRVEKRVAKIKAHEDKINEIPGKFEELQRQLRTTQEALLELTELVRVNNKNINPLAWFAPENNLVKKDILRKMVEEQDADS